MSISDLPEIQFVDTDPMAIETGIITLYESISGRTLAPGDPVRLFLLSVAALIIQQRALLNYAAQQNLLRYAEGPYLDNLGALVETPRLTASPALTTVRFTLSAVQPDAILIPAGVRLTTPAGEVFFATREVAEISAGDLTADILCVCLQAGTIGNGFLPGQINVLVDPQPFVASVSNQTESSGGADVETDDPYRGRIHTSPERFSVAGPSGAYEYWARTANPNILDVRVHSPAATEVEILVLMAGGELPDSNILDAVDAVVNDRSIRPLTDQVTVAAPDVINYTIDIEYWIDAENTTEAIAIQAAVERAVEAYVLWQKSRIGRNVNPSELVRLVMNAGARRVVVTEPTYTVLDDTEIAIIDDPDSEITVTYGGIEDD